MKMSLSKRLLWPWLAVALCLIYASGTLGFFALRALLPRWPPWLALMNSFAPFLFAPLLVVLPVALLTRSKAAWVGFLAVLALFTALYGDRFAPRFRTAAAPTDGVLTIMTFNLGFDRSDPGQLAAAIESERADILAVQELSPYAARLLRERLSQHYPYMILDSETGTGGVLSRYPILNNEWFQPANEGRRALYATLDVGGALVHVFAVHPFPPGLSWYNDTPLPTGLYDEENERQMADVVQRATNVNGPVLVIGDFNMSDQTRAYARLSSVFRDAYREVGWGLGLTFPYDLHVGGFPVPGPLVRIDYVFHSEDLHAEQVHVTCKGGSDHCYLVAQLTQTFSRTP